MAANIIWYISVFGCAVLFCGIGVFAMKADKPMWFWSGSTVDPAAIADIKQYNRENARMWMKYSLWYWFAGFAWIWSGLAALVILVLGCTVGIARLIQVYHKIEKKHIKTGI